MFVRDGAIMPMKQLVGQKVQDVLKRLLGKSNSGSADPIDNHLALTSSCP